MYSRCLPRLVAYFLGHLSRSSFSQFFLVFSTESFVTTCTDIRVALLFSCFFILCYPLFPCPYPFPPKEILSAVLSASVYISILFRWLLVSSHTLGSECFVLLPQSPLCFAGMLSVLSSLVYGRASGKPQERKRERSLLLCSGRQGDPREGKREGNRNDQEGDRYDYYSQAE